MVGGCNFDFVARLDEDQVNFTGATHPGRLEYSHGGVGRNVADALALLDAGPRLASAVGTDRPGTDILAANGKLDTSLVMVHPTAATATYTAIIDREGDCKFGKL